MIFNNMSDMFDHINDNNAELLFEYYEKWSYKKENQYINECFNKIKTEIPTAFNMTRKPFGFSVPCIDGTLKVAVIEMGNTIKIRGRFKTAEIDLL